MPRGEVLGGGVGDVELARMHRRGERRHIVIDDTVGMYARQMPASQMRRSARRAVSISGWRPSRMMRASDVTIPTTSSTMTTIPAARPSVHAAPLSWCAPVTKLLEVPRRRVWRPRLSDA
jgi:hypothetical protein